MFWQSLFISQETNQHLSSSNENFY